MNASTSEECTPQEQFLLDQLAEARIDNESDILGVLSASSCETALIVEGYGIPSGYSSSWTGLIQEKNQTIMQRIVTQGRIIRDHLSESATRLHLECPGELCRLYCQRLSASSFWDQGPIIGRLAMGGCFADVWCKHRGSLHHVTFSLWDCEYRFRPHRRSIVFLLKAAPWRLRFAGFWIRLLSR